MLLTNVTVLLTHQYSLTERGKSLIPILDGMCEWETITEMNESFYLKHKSLLSNAESRLLYFGNIIVLGSKQ